MTIEQYNEVKKWMDEQGINLDFLQTGELDMVIRRTKGDAPLLCVDKDSIQFDTAKREQIVKRLLSVVLSDTHGADDLEEILLSTVGYALATKDDILGELKHFANYVIDTASEIGNLKGLKFNPFKDAPKERKEGGDIVIPFTPNKVKS